MKSTFWVGLVLGALLVFALSASRNYFSTSAANNKVKDSVITFQATGSPKELVFGPDRNSKCPPVFGQNGDKFGCIGVALDEQGRIAFKLKTASWHMTEMTICKGGTKPTSSCSLSASEQKEFAVKIEGNLTRYSPDQNGVINFGVIPGDISEFKLLDLNNIQAKTDYFYTLKACKNNDLTNCAVTDPLISNGGRQ